MQIVRASFWIAVYLGMVAAPLFVLLAGPQQRNGGFWWDFAVALGFAGAAMMGVQFMLTARFKRAAAPFGIDIIYYFHRYVALVALALVVAHPVILAAVDPAVLGYLNPARAPWEMTAGVAAVPALAALIVASWWRKPLGIGYDGWRRWHAGLAVAALALAFTHIAGAGNYLSTPWKRGLWILIGASCVGATAYVRAARPWRMLRRPYDVKEVRAERGDAWTVVVEPRGHLGFRHQPGQFAWLTLRASPFAMREHPFSISSAPSASGHLEFTIKELGDFTRTVGSVQPGETAYVDGPYGAFTPNGRPAPGYVFIAGGIGIAPHMSMLRAMAQRRDTRPVMLFYAYRRWERMTFREAIEELRSRMNLKVTYVLAEPPDGWEGETGWITPEMLDRHLPGNRREVDYFLCGPDAMTRAMERALHGLGIPMGRIHTELFDMA
ncbi:MAG: ferric reductase-like transmembrane domain-containing protein [Gemmatimonadota bacterium]|nr:ferric reductase-like transmembrane domain-containing protein [Gemmatimonadota bacterium]MDE3216113.1 ferric reductase-like transmembrane domain-containing protein [Gemmatimonadota bacterium]